MPKSVVRPYKLELRLSARERQILQRIAQIEDITMGEVVRLLLRDAGIRYGVIEEPKIQPSEVAEPKAEYRTAGQPSEHKKEAN